MSSKMLNKDGNKRGILQRNTLSHEMNTQTPFVTHTVARPSLQLSDRSEFPSLNESAEQTSCDLQSALKCFRYSDKVKAQPFSQNETSGILNPSDAIIDKSYSQSDDKAVKKIAGKSNTKPNVDDNQHPNAHVELSDDSHKTDIAAKPCDNKNKSAKEKNLQSSKRTPEKNFASKNTNSLSNPGSQARKSVKSTSKNSESSKVSTEVQQEGSKAKKKKRKSKVKRQVEFQTGKIMVLTPEVHLKIMNQTSSLSSQNIPKILTDINDEEEYPELGKAVMPTSQKENFLQKNMPSDFQKKTKNKSADIPEKNVDKISESKNIVSDGKSVEIKGKKDIKEKIHIKDPITISFYEMLQEKNKLKDKEPKHETVIHNHVVTAKIKTKKNLGPHNLLDSSSPAVKRGKEREKPKQKKPSQLKKIILMDRKTRKENLLQVKSSSEEKNFTNDSGCAHEENTDEDSGACTENSNARDENNFSNLSLAEEKLAEIPLLESENTDLGLQHELISEMGHLNLSEMQETQVVNDLTSFPNEDTEAENVTAHPFIDSSNEITESGKNVDVSSTEMHSNITKSAEFLLSNLMGNVKTVMPDKERAAKILLHTRHFREYCNHLISKDIDDVVFALLEDLARFQDRLHQKDPVKARMKRRLIYGVKEVKKHIKLRKLKCIIIAVDIENVETHGGLNDVLSDIKTLAAEHHIPCVFALSRKVLGKVCHKPVPVSCVGVFNYEGSEVNFRKMVELQTQSKVDYNEIYDKLVSKLTDKEVEALIRAKKEAPETLRAIRADILDDFFLEPKTEKDESAHLQSTYQVPDIINEA